MKRFILSDKFKPLFLADECVDTSTIDLLCKLNFSVVSVKDLGLCGKSDLVILRWAIEHSHILISQDKDFSSIMLYPPRLHHGIIVLRKRRKTKIAVYETLHRLFKEVPMFEFRKSLIIVDAEKYRIRKE